jgi:DNA-binding NtrC family response regulator
MTFNRGMTTSAVVSRNSGGVLIASPSTFLREQVLDSLPAVDYPVQQAFGGADALVKLENGEWQVLFLDRRLPDLDPEELIGIIRQRFPEIEVVVLDSDSGQPLHLAQSAGEGPRSPDRDHTMPRPLVPCRVVTDRQPALASSKVEPLPGMIGQSEPMQRLYRMTRLVAARNTTVLIAGATGTGKELVARAIHKLSPRGARPFVIVNCAAIPESLLESELFGYMRGAFTGAVQSHLGRIQAAHGGTLFLDEIGELPLSLQPKLLRFLEQREVQRLGSTEAIRVDVRVLAATNANLTQLVAQGGFRPDLYYRLSAFPLEIPPLAERIEDIVPLAEYFLALGTEGMNRSGPQLTPETLQMLEAHPWEGNVRELQHLMERASILAEGGGQIRPEHLLFSPAIASRLEPKETDSRRTPKEILGPAPNRW